MADRRKEAKEYKEGPDRRKDSVTANLIHSRFVWADIQAAQKANEGPPEVHKKRADKDRRQRPPGWEYGHIVADRRKTKADRRAPVTKA